MKFRWYWFLLIIVIPTALALAQAPDPINAALRDLSARAGKNITVNDLENWSYEQALFDDTSLGCPQPGVVYAQVKTSGFKFTLTYAGTDFDYRVSNDQTIVIACGSTLAPPVVPVCPPPGDTAYLQPRLTIGAQGRVENNGFPNVVRDQPGTSGRYLGEIPPNALFTVMDGPKCSTLDKIVWWQVNYNNTLIGWTAEGKDGDYWLEPPDFALTPTAAVGTPAPLNVTVAGTVSNLGNYGAPLALLEGSQKIAVGSPAGTVVVADLRTNTRLYETPGQGGAITALAAGTDTRANVPLLASGSADGVLVLWANTTGTFMQRARLTAPGAAGGIAALAFSPDGSLLASSAGDGIVRLWDTSSGALLSSLSGHTALVTSLNFSADGSALVSRAAAGAALVWGIR